MTGLIRDLVSVDTAFVLLSFLRLESAPEIPGGIDFLVAPNSGAIAPGRDKS